MNGRRTRTRAARPNRAKRTSAPKPTVSTAAATHPILQLQQTIGNQAVQQLLQTSLTPAAQPQAGGPAIATPVIDPTGATLEPPAETSVSQGAVLWADTFPLESLVTVGETKSLQALYEEMLANPADAARLGRDVAVKEALEEYLADKRQWPVRIELQEHEGVSWYHFSVYGEELVASRTPRLPLDSLDAVSFESLHTVIARASARAVQVVEAALIQAAFPEILAEVGDKPEEMTDDPAEYAYNEVRAQWAIANALFERADAVMRTLDPANEWLRYPFGVLHPQIRHLRDRTKVAEDKVSTFWRNNQPSRTYGEVYGENIKEWTEEGGFLGNVKAGLGRSGRLIGEIVTGGGQGLDAQNAQMYRRGEISYSAFKRNRWFNIGRVGVNALATALTAGRASGPAMRLLGLEAGTLASTVTAGMAEGMVGGLTEALSSDVYAKVVSHVTDSPGVRAFHEATVGGPEAWLASTAWGGVLGGGIPVGLTVATKIALRRSKLPRETPTARASAAETSLETQRKTSLDQPDPIFGGDAAPDVRVISADKQTGELTLSFRNPTTGEFFIAEGNAHTGNATVRRMVTGEVVGHFRAGKYGPPAPGGSLPAPAEVTIPPEFGGAPVAEPPLRSVIEDVPAAPLRAPEASSVVADAPVTTPAPPAPVAEAPRGRRILVAVPKKAPAQPVEPPVAAPPEPKPPGPETGLQLERRTLGADQPQRVASPTRFSWEGGARGTFGSFADSLRTFARNFSSKIPRLRRRVLRQPTRDFIAERPDLQQHWDAELAQLTDEIGRLRDAMRQARGDKVTLADLRRREAALQNRLTKLNDWGNQPVQKKRPDLIEVFPAESRIDVTDITQRPFDPSHNFKMRFYIEVLRELTGWQNVTGVEFHGPFRQNPID